jgi:NitT/TauT family transport system substrate-binding protein
MGTRRARGKALLLTTMALTLSLALSLAAGCGKTEAQAPAGAGLEKTDLNVAVVPALDSAGFFVALYAGLFKAEGLNVTFTPATSSDTVIADQVKGTYDITGGNYVSYIQAQQSGRADLDIFAEGSVMEPGTQGIYIRPDSKITSMAGLAGKTVAINAPKNILYLLAASMMAEKGMDPTSVKFVTVPFPKMAAELASGAVDAALLPEPFASQAEEVYGAVPLVDLNQGATTSFPVAGYVVTKQWAAKYPRTLAAFYRALEEGQQAADTNRADVEQAMEDLPVKPVPLAVSRETAALMALDSYPVSSGPAGSVDLIRLERVVNVMHQFLGFGTFDIKSMLMSG